ncbi:MAG: hypothetical protein HN730_01505, partial [Bdellovibrionales bacterium]|nr:hypothetical protein [Bdellovibrionales bacterium]
MVVSSLLYLLSLLLIVLVVNNLRSGERRLNLYQQLRNGVDRLLGAQQVTQGEQLIRSI